MATVSPVNGETLLVQIGDGGSPETFAHKCMINTSRGYDFSAEVSQAAIADCGSPGNPAYMRRIVKTVSLDVSGAGIYDAASSKFFADWLVSGAAKNVRINQTNTGANGGWYATCSMVLTKFSASADARDTATAQLSLQSAGAITITANA